MKEKNQAEWIYEVLGKKKGIFGASIRELTDADEKKIKDKMLQYWKEHNDESTEFLVNGAILCCSRGSDYSTLNSADHGVYTDSSETGALANTDDKKFDGFVACSKWNDEPLVSKHICRFKLGEWRNVRKSVTINGKYALDTNSYLPCKHGGIISPVTSGQEYTLSKSYNKYPKFLNDDGTVDELIVKKLLLRNVSVMKESEIDALIKLGMYLCVCKDVEILKKIINCGYLYTDYRIGLAESGVQCTLLDNFIFVCAWAETCCRFSAHNGTIPIIQNSSWEQYDKACNYIKINSDHSFKIVSDLALIETEISDMFLNIKLLETILLAGNLYKKNGNEAIVSLITRIGTVKSDSEAKTVKIYTLSYVDGRMDNILIKDKISGTITSVIPGFIECRHKVHLFAASEGKISSGDYAFQEEVSKCIGANISGLATIISYGTAAVSLAMANPIFAAISAPVGIICTLLSTSVGVADAMRADKEIEYNRVLANKANIQNTHISNIVKCIGGYIAYACFEKIQPEDNKRLWDIYKLEYKEYTDQEARKKGYATKERISNFSLNTSLFIGENYSISVLDGENTLKRLENFNNNMKNIRIGGKDGFGETIAHKTISEGERLDKFTECRNLSELIKYMDKKTDAGEYYIDVLDTIGLAGSSFEGEIIYSSGVNEKVINKKGSITLKDLFTFDGSTR